MRDQPFYRGKIAVATFFAVTALPQLTALRRTAESDDLAIMELDDDAL